MTSIHRGSCPAAISPLRPVPAGNLGRAGHWRRRATAFVGRAFTALALATLAVPAVMAQGAATPPFPPGWDAPEPWRTDRFYLQTSIASVHFHPDDEHDNSQVLINPEWRLDKQWLKGQVLLGAASFDNSFGQSTWYAYSGLLWRPVETVQPFYLKLTAGVIHGYRGEYQDKIPMNGSGYAPAIIPSVGYCYSRVCSEVVLFGAAGLMWTVGLTLP